MYQEQVKKQKKISSHPKEIKKVREYEVEKILNRREKLCQVKERYIVKENTWKSWRIQEI